MMIRQTLRQELYKKRLQVDAAKQRQAAILILQQIKVLPEFISSQYIAAYYAHQNEIDPMSILEQAWELKKQCYLPVLHNEALRFAQYQRQNALQLNQFNIAEPLPTHLIEPSQLDMVFVPLIAFDLQGYRLGMGKGYYDRTFAFLAGKTAKKPYLIGLAYEFQKVNSVFPEKWDIPLDMVITEKQTYEFS